MPIDIRSLVGPSRPQPSEDPQWSRRALVGAGIAVSLSMLSKFTLGGSSSTAQPLDLGGNIMPGVLEACRALVDGRIGQADWQAILEHDFKRTSPSDIADEMQLGGLLSQESETRPIRGATNVHLSLPTALHAKLEAQAIAGFGLRLHAFRAGRANPPHAHDNVAALTYVLRGRFRVRHYDRIHVDEGETLPSPTALLKPSTLLKPSILLKPSMDRILLPGDATSFSDVRDNVHWHEAETDGVLLVVYCKDLGGFPARQVMVDPVNAQDAGGGLLRAPLVPSLGEALERFG